jgi:tripartite-type tricarboxylate transporter receptor subunit TctC
MQRRALLAATLPTAALAQSDWPALPVRLIVPVAAGGPTDVPARILAEAMSGFLRNRIVVKNRTGSGVIVGTEIVARAPRDGQTLLYGTVAHAFAQAVFPRLSYDPVTDFTPVAMIGQVPMIMLVKNDFPARTLAELIALVRANPGRYDYASAGNGSSVHLATELFLRSAGGLKMNHVTFRGTAAAVPDLLAGRIPMVIEVGGAALPQAQRGALRPLAISSAQRSPLAPEIPTFMEAGLPG